MNLPYLNRYIVSHCKWHCIVITSSPTKWKVQFTLPHSIPGKGGWTQQEFFSGGGGVRGGWGEGVSRISTKAAQIMWLRREERSRLSVFIAIIINLAAYMQMDPWFLYHTAQCTFCCWLWRAQNMSSPVEPVLIGDSLETGTLQWNMELHQLPSTWLWFLQLPIFFQW